MDEIAKQWLEEQTYAILPANRIADVLSNYMTEGGREMWQYFLAMEKAVTEDSYLLVDMRNNPLIITLVKGIIQIFQSPEPERIQYRIMIFIYQDGKVKIVT
jgi:hypothetical protein